jgi:hypothetical protein
MPRPFIFGFNLVDRVAPAMAAQPTETPFHPAPQRRLRNRSTEETWLYRRDTSCLVARDGPPLPGSSSWGRTVWLPAIVNMLASFTLMASCKGTAHTYAIRKCHPPRSHRDVFLACRVCSGLISRSSFVCACAAPTTSWQQPRRTAPCSSCSQCYKWGDAVFPSNRHALLSLT